MRLLFRSAVAALSLVGLASCGESPSSPVATPTRSLSAAAPAFDYASAGYFGDQVTSFVVQPIGGSFSIVGLFNVTFPANSICDPSVSSYGDGTWDLPCSTLKQPIKITAQVRLTSSGLAVDFTPALRFSPAQQVTISTDVFAPFIRYNRDYFAAHPSALRPFAMYYSPTLGGVRIADYLSDYSLVTHIDLTTGRVWRRVKHFSGINLTSGDSCDPVPGDPDCIEI